MAESQEARRRLERLVYEYPDAPAVSVAPDLLRFCLKLLTEQDELRELVREAISDGNVRCIHLNHAPTITLCSAERLMRSVAPPVEAATDEEEPRPIKPSGSRAPDQQGFQHG
jgi:hypothetical protein